METNGVEGTSEAAEADFGSPAALLVLHDTSDAERVGLAIRAVHSNHIAPLETPFERPIPN